MGKFGLGAFFRRWGHSAGNRPWTWISCSFVIIIGLSAGVVVREDENRPEKMWVAEEAPAIRHKDYVDDNWPADFDMEMYIATCPKNVPSCNMLEPTRLKEVFNGHISFYGAVVDGTQLSDDLEDDYEVIKGDPETDLRGKYGGRNWVLDKNLYPGNARNLHSKCSLWNENTCDATNIFSSVFDGDVTSGAHPQNPTYFDSNFVTLQQVIDRINTYTNAPPNRSRGQGVYSSFLGNITRNDTGHITGATHFLHTWGISNMWVRDKKNRREDKVNQKLEYQGICGLGVDIDVDGESCLTSNTFENVKIYAQFQRTYPDAFGVSFLGDIINLTIAYVLIVVYMASQLGKRDSVHNMLGLAFVALLIVVCSMQASTGLGFLIGVKNTNLVQILWFLILGLGVDDAFVIVNEFSRTTKKNPSKSIPDRISLTAESAGYSILVTSLTDALAFLIGSLTILPALRGFCIFCGLAVTMCFILQMTIFLPCIAINAARAEQNRYDILCCVKSKKQHDHNDPQGYWCIPGKPNVLEKVFAHYCSVIFKTPVTVAAFAISLGLLAVGIFGVTQLEMDFKIEWFIPEDNNAHGFITENEAVFGQSLPATVYIPNSVDHYAERASISAIGTYISSNSIFQPGRSISWATEFEQSGNMDTASAAQYYSSLHTWLQGPGNRFEKLLQWSDNSDPTKGVKDSKMLTMLKSEYTESGLQRYDTMVLFRKELDTLVPGAFPYAFMFLFREEAGIVMQEFVRNLIIAGVCIFLTIFTLIWDIRISLLVCLGLVFSIAEVVGFAHFWGVTVNSTSVIFILLCVGLTVDYSAHIAHMFRISHGTAVERSTAAMIRIGPSVFNALMSTLLAVIVLAFASSYVFRVFFKILCLTTIFAGAQGLLFLPIWLSLFGGSKEKDEKDDYSPTATANTTLEPEDLDVDRTSGGNSTEETVSTTFMPRKSTEQTVPITSTPGNSTEETVSTTSTPGNSTKKTDSTTYPSRKSMEATVSTTSTPEKSTEETVPNTSTLGNSTEKTDSTTSLPGKSMETVPTTSTMVPPVNTTALSSADSPTTNATPTANTRIPQDLGVDPTTGGNSTEETVSTTLTLTPTATTTQKPQGLDVDPTTESGKSAEETDSTPSTTVTAGITTALDSADTCTEDIDRKFKCTDSPQCILTSLKSNGRNDCLNDSDEAECGTK